MGITYHLPSAPLSLFPVPASLSRPQPRTRASAPWSRRLAWSSSPWPATPTNSPNTWCACRSPLPPASPSPLSLFLSLRTSPRRLSLTCRCGATCDYTCVSAGAHERRPLFSLSLSLSLNCPCVSAGAHERLRDPHECRGSARVPAEPVHGPGEPRMQSRCNHPPTFVWRPPPAWPLR